MVKNQNTNLLSTETSGVTTVAEPIKQEEKNKSPETKVLGKFEGFDFLHF